MTQKNTGEETPFTFDDAHSQISSLEDGAGMDAQQVHQKIDDAMSAITCGNDLAAAVLAYLKAVDNGEPSIITKTARERLDEELYRWIGAAKGLD